MVVCFSTMPSYKIHSIKNNKKLSFIIDGESEEKVKQILSLDGFIVITIDPFFEDPLQENYFIFNALKDKQNRIEGKITAPDIFQAYKILKEDYRYTLLKLYPAALTDEKEQEFIFQNVVDVFAGLSLPETEKDEDLQNNVSSITTGEITIMKHYFEILIPLITDSDLKDKETILTDIKKIMLTNSLSRMEILMKKTTKTLYEQADVKKKKAIYKTLLPIIKRTSIFVLPPGYFFITEAVRKISKIWKILFVPSSASDKLQKEKMKNLTSQEDLRKKNLQEKYIFSNKNIQLLLQKKYRSSWMDIVKPGGGYPYFYSLMRQRKILFWFKKMQEYIGKVGLYT